MCLQSYCQHIPKAELHIHIEGTLEPEMLFYLAQKNNVQMPYDTVAQVKQSYQFDNLQSFLNMYYQGVSVLITEQDFYYLMWAYLKRAVTDTVKRAEIFFDPQSHTQRGIAFETVIKGFYRAITDFEKTADISCMLIMCFLRHLGGDEALKTLQQALPYTRYFGAVGLDSSEVGYPPNLFKEAYDLARSKGLKLVAHAGEEAGPCYIHEALNILGVQRIDHGVQCVQDPALITHLAQKRIPLTLCPLSNVKLCIYNTLTQCPAKILLDKGVCVTINSDDPSYFGGYVAQNYWQLAQALHLSRADIYQLAKNSFEASFITDTHRHRLYQHLQDFDKNFDGAE